MVLDSGVSGEAGFPVKSASRFTVSCQPTKIGASQFSGESVSRATQKPLEQRLFRPPPRDGCLVRPARIQFSIMRPEEGVLRRLRGRRAGSVGSDPRAGRVARRRADFQAAPRGRGPESASRRAPGISLMLTVFRHSPQRREPRRHTGVRGSLASCRAGEWLPEFSAPRPNPGPSALTGRGRGPEIAAFCWGMCGVFRAAPQRGVLSLAQRRLPALRRGKQGDPGQLRAIAPGFSVICPVLGSSSFFRPPPQHGALPVHQCCRRPLAMVICFPPCAPARGPACCDTRWPPVSPPARSSDVSGSGHGATRRANFPRFAPWRVPAWRIFRPPPRFWAPGRAAVALLGASRGRSERALFRHTLQVGDLIVGPGGGRLLRQVMPPWCGSVPAKRGRPETAPFSRPRPMKGSCLAPPAQSLSWLSAGATRG